MVRKVQIQFTATDLMRISACRREDQTLASLVRDALTFACWVARARADGWTLVAIKGDQTREPVLF
jgi:hypothetical protein